MKNNQRSNLIVITSGRDHKVKIFAKDGTPLFVFSDHSNWVRAIVLQNDGRFLFSGSDDENIIIWDLVNGGKVSKEKCHDHFILNLALHNKYNLLASVSSDCLVKIWEY